MYQNLSHQELLTRMQADDRFAMRFVFEQQYPLVCRTINRLITDPGLTEDLAQEVFVRFWEKRHDIQIESNLAAYLRRMAINEALAHLRRKNRFAPDELTADLPEQQTLGADTQYLATEMQQAIHQAIDELPPRCKTIFQLSRYEELTYQEIANQLELSVKTVENQMGKALKTLREKLSGYMSLFL